MTRNPAPHTPVVEVEDLRVVFDTPHGELTAIDGISFEVRRGECLAIVGESGSGKSVTARALLGLNGSHATTTAGLLRLFGEDAPSDRAARWRDIRGRRIGYVLQDALVSLDPLRRVGNEVSETLEVHRIGTRATRSARTLEALEHAGIPDPERRAAQHPHELSGGLRQRALIAAAISASPDVVIADEPTTALDATVQAQVIDLLRTLRDEGVALLVISHDLGVVRALADRIIVVRSGQVIESGTAEQVLGHPTAGYTRELILAVPRIDAGGPPPQQGDPAPLVQVERISKSFPSPEGPRPVLRDVSIEIAQGETLGIVGESGSGKTTLARAVLGLTSIDTGSISFAGTQWNDITERQRRPLRSRLSAVYQDPLSSFDPRWTVQRILDDALRPLISARAARRDEAISLLERVGLSSEHAHRHPLTLSGGQRQRVAIARAISTVPSLIVCDEAVSALDVSVQAQILGLLADLQRQSGVSFLFITHDIGVVRQVSHRIAVMKDGEIVEHGAAAGVLDSPAHPYTIRLLDAVAGVHGTTETGMTS